MADPPSDDDLAPDREAQFLTRLWNHLEGALELSSGTDALSNLDEVLSHCEAAAALIRAWRAWSN